MYNSVIVALGLIGITLVGAVAPARAEDKPPVVLFDMDTVAHQPGTFEKDKKKVPAGTAELVDGKLGKAVKFSFADGASGGFFMARVRPTADWDAADGFSFWLKGDGSDHTGGIELVDPDDFASRYAYCFPIKNTEWQKVTVRWSDLTPETNAPLMDAKVGYPPSHLGNFWFGKWWYWRDYAAHSYAIDQVQLEPKIEPAPAPPAAEPGIARFARKLREHKPVTIVTMGDSLTDTHHWANRKTVWAQQVADAIKAKYGSDVTLVNPAMGGTTLSQNIVLIPRWLQAAPKPDLVTIWFGGNDWAAGVRGPRFAEYLRLAVDRVRQQTGGSADLLLMTTEPTHDNWETYKELEEAIRNVAGEKKTALVDLATEFRKAGDPDRALQQEYYAWDKVHLGSKGHEVTREAVLKVMEDAK